MSVQKQEVVIKNKKASFEYHFILEMEAGIMLTGSEIKSIRDGKANISDAYCSFENGELFVRNMHISEYKQATYLNHEPRRNRKLLLNKQEIRKLENKLKDKGVTVIPTKLYFNDRGICKLNIALAKGKKLYDKREDLKSKDNQREMARNQAD